MAAPKLTNLSDTAFDENVVNDGFQTLDASVTLTDADGDFDGGVVTVSGLLAEDIVSVAGSGTVARMGNNIWYDADGAGGAAPIHIGVASGGVGATFTVTLNANATTAAVEALVESLVYANASDTPTATRNLKIGVVDAAGHGSTAPVWDASVFSFSTLGSINPGRAQLADINGDGLADVLYGQPDGRLLVLMGNGTGTYLAVGTLLVTGAGNAAPAAGDLDGDGDIDLVVGSGGGALKVYYNVDGSYVLQAGHSLATFAEGAASVPTLGDLDNDGDVDAVIGTASGLFYAYINDGTGTFTGTWGGSVGGGGNAAPALIDLDGNGWLDLLVGYADGTFGVVYFGEAGFTGVSDLAYKGWDVGSNGGPAVGDIDGDGDEDLILLSQDGDATRVYYVENIAETVVTVTVNAQAEPAPTPQPVRPTLGDVATSVTFGENTVNATPQRLDTDVSFRDFDGIAPGSENSAFLRVSGLLAEDRVSLAHTDHVTLLSDGRVLYDADGAGSDAPYLVGNAIGGSGADFIVSFSNLANAAAIEAVIEALTYANVSDDPTASRELTINVSDGDGLSSFAPRFEFDSYAGGTVFGTVANLAVGEIAGSVAIVAGREDGTINHSDGTAIAAFAGIDVGTNAAPILLDYDGDGDDDLIVGAGDGTLHYFRNVGGVFVERTGAANPFNGLDFGSDASPSFGDIDGDGDLDLLVAHAGGVAWRINTGGVFGGGGEIAGAWTGAQVVLGDLDGDHRLDVAVAAGNDVLRGYRLDYSGGVLSIGANIEVPPTGGIGTGAVAFGDLNNDGFDDMIIVASNNRFIYLNAPQWGRTITVNVTAESDEIVGTNGHDTNLQGTPDEDVIRGLNGNDVIHALGSDDRVYGGAGNDTLYGDGGDDELYADAGNDTLVGGEGSDLLVGGLGNDTYVIDDLYDTVLEAAGEGTDTVKASVSHTLHANVENLVLTGSDDIDGLGNALANVLTGNVGDNVLSGYAGNDTLAGGLGDDTLEGGEGVDKLDGGDDDDFLYGEAGADTIVGGAGADRIQGGAGRDVLTGGVGGDTFVFTNADVVSTRAGGVAELDKILDFKPSEGDVIDLSGIDANINLAGDQAFTWATGNVFHKTAGEAVMKFVAGKATLQLDVDGDGKADFMIEITGVSTGISDNGDGRGGGGGGSLHPTVGWVM